MSSESVFLFTDFAFGIKNEIIEERVSKLFFGGLAGSLALFVTHPIDVVKQNVQVKPLTVSQIIKYYSVKNHGLKRIYKGIGSSMSRAMIYCNFRFELYELARRNNMLNTFDRKLIVAGLSGGVGGCLVTPMVKVHVRMQNDDLFPTNERRYYKGLYDGLHSIYRQEGSRSLFAGTSISAMRGAMSSIGQIALYEEVKQLIHERGNFGQGDFITCLISSITAGTAATILQQPFDVIVSKFMNAPHGQFKHVWHLVRDFYVRNGLRGFYRGVLAGFVRIIPQTIVTYITLEYLRSNFGMMLKTRRTGDTFEIISIDEMPLKEKEKVILSKVESKK